MLKPVKSEPKTEVNSLNKFCLDDEADSGRVQETGEQETYSFSAAN